MLTLSARPATRKARIMATAVLSPLWGDISITFADRLQVAGVSRSVAEVDSAIQTVLENERDASDAYALPSEVYVEERFDDIVEAVCEQLDVDYDVAVAL